MRDHKSFLLHTIQLAEQRLGFCAPNPAVGAVVVKDHRIIATGFHWGAGHAHAEVMALDTLGDAARGAILYVSLEPCCHVGRTPPCVARIQRAGIAKVYMGFVDPNPVVAGQGQQQLQQSGIACEQVALPEIDLFYQPYTHWVKNQKPLVTAKLAWSADCKIASTDKKPAAITGKECQAFTHHHRKQSDALLTTINTILQDDPQMNVRLDDCSISKPVYILDSQARLSLQACIWKTAQSVTVFHAEYAAPTAVEKLKSHGARCIMISDDQWGLNLSHVLNQIGRDGFHTLWIEAGSQCFRSFLKQNYLQRVFIYVSPESLGTAAYLAPVSLEMLKKRYQHMEKKQYGRDEVYCFT